MGQLIEALHVWAQVGSRPPAGDVRSAARLQTVGLDNLKLNSAERLDPILYWTWKASIKNAIDRMNLDQDIVLQLLRTKNHLPDKIRDSVRHADTLSALFSRIEKQTPELGSAVHVVVKRIVGLRQCGTDGQAIEDRCSKLRMAF